MPDGVVVSHAESLDAVKDNPEVVEEIFRVWAAGGRPPTAALN